MTSEEREQLIAVVEGEVDAFNYTDWYHHGERAGARLRRAIELGRMLNDAEREFWRQGDRTPNQAKAHAEAQVLNDALGCIRQALEPLWIGRPIAIGERSPDRIAFEHDVQRARERLMNDGPPFDKLPRLYVRWDVMHQPTLYWQGIPDEIARWLADSIVGR